MKVSAIAVGGFQVDEEYLSKAASAALGMRGPLICHTGDAVTMSCVMGSVPALLYEWDVPESVFPKSVSKARVKITISNLSDVTLKRISAQRTQLQVTLNSPPEIALGTQAWDRKLDRLGDTQWSSLGDALVDSASLSHELQEAFQNERTHKLILNHSSERIQNELHKVCIADSALAASPRPAVQKRPLSRHNRLQQQLAKVNREHKKQKFMGCVGALCDDAPDEHTQ